MQFLFLMFLVPAGLGFGEERCFKTEELVQQYNKNSQIQAKWAFEALNKYPFTGTERILDVGCGDGKITQEIASKVNNGLVVGLDISNEMLKFASDTFPLDKNPNLLFVQGDAEQFECYNQFDLAVSFCCLHRVKNLRKALKQIHSSLREDGEFILVVPTRTNPYIQACHAIVKTEKWKPHFEGFKYNSSFDDYERMLIETGFDPLRIEISESETVFESHQAFSAFFVPVSSALSYLPEIYQNEFIEDLIHLMEKERPPANENEVRMCWSKLEIEARKITGSGVTFGHSQN